MAKAIYAISEQRSPTLVRAEHIAFSNPLRRVSDGEFLIAVSCESELSAVFTLQTLQRIAIAEMSVGVRPLCNALLKWGACGGVEKLLESSLRPTCEDPYFPLMAVLAFTCILKPKL